MLRITSLKQTLTFKDLKTGSNLLYTVCFLQKGKRANSSQDVVTACYNNRSKQINTLSTKLHALSVQPGGAHTYHQSLNGSES